MARTTSPVGLALIKRHEALRLYAYDDATGKRAVLPLKGKLTIGWGHTGYDVYIGMTIDETKALELLEKDVAWTERIVNVLVKVPLTQPQFDALVSFVFNIGSTQFSTSTMLRLLDQGDYDGAAGQFHRWNYIEGEEVSAELTRRRAEEKALFNTGAA
jgi:lysozyme